MRITYRGDYALKALLDLALHYDENVVTINDLAKRTDAPTKFLEQVLLGLKRGGFVESRRGKVGGYRLAKPPSEIKLGYVVRFVDGPVEPISCLEGGYSGCRDIYRCVLKNVWERVAKATSEIIDNITFEDLVSQLKKKQGAVVYAI
ncbi:MAG: Rrf2 family transcriptional regulator [Candidatus Omnitrophota bacterium]